MKVSTQQLLQLNTQMVCLQISLPIIAGKENEKKEIVITRLFLMEAAQIRAALFSN
jgi:hypothetical protein